LAIPVAAQETTPYASSYFMSRDAFLWRTSSTSCQAWFEVTAVRGMAELGAMYIDIEESSDGVNWYVVETYYRSNNSNMMAYNTSDHCSYVTFSEMKPGYQYRMYVSLYAKGTDGNSGSSGAYGYFAN
jgi:hypothetical protein